MKKKGLIFIPGYKGSMLKDVKSKKTVWFSLRQLLGNQTLAYQKTVPTCYEAGVLSRIHLWQSLYFYDIYHSFLTDIESHFSDDYAIFIFSYDWRKDLLDNVERFFHFVEHLKKDTTISFFDIIAHSLGALIVGYYLRYGADVSEFPEETWAGTSHLRNIFFAGGPFKGTLQAVKELHYGDRIIFNKVILSASVIQTFPVSYQLLPPSMLVNTADGLDLPPINLWESENWERFQLGGFNLRNTHSEQTHLKKTMDERLLNGHKFVRSFSREVKKIPEAHQVKIVNFYGEGIKTVQQCVIHKEKQRYKLRFNYTVEGDGVVSVDSAKTPAMFNSFSPIDISVRQRHRRLFHHEHVKHYIYKVLGDE